MNSDCYKDDCPDAHNTPDAKPGTPPAKKKTALDMFGRDITALARNGEIDPMIGRTNELERVIQVLCRRTKNNPVLIGEAGVGKTAIVEGLAQAIIDENVPEIMLGKRIIALDMALMVAGTVYRGQFEERIKKVLQEVREDKKVILFMDEIHTIVGAGAAEGAMDAANIIKPALSRGDLQCIGATTLNEYKKSIEKDAALERRFQSIIVHEPSIETSIDMLMGIRHKYEKHHQVNYTDEAIKVAARLSSRYITGRYLPDKAIDMIDEAGARARILAMTRPKKLKDAESELNKVRTMKEDATKKQAFEESAKFRDRERKLREKLDKMVTEWAQSQTNKILSITGSDISTIVSKMTGIPLKTMEGDELKKLINMESEMDKMVVGQTEAIATLSKCLRRSRADLKDPKRPIGSFLFLGPTGVGKTLLAKSLAKFMFGSSDSLVQIDMSEYMEKFNVSRLVGSPPGYVGYEEGGQLTEKIRRRPYSVILLDEVEKAHPDVLHMLLQVMEEGRLTDGLGRQVDFRNTILIMTSNLGYDISAKSEGLGFGGTKEDESQSRVKQQILDVAKSTFKPELLNRLDDIIVFRSLTADDMLRILELELNNVRARLREKGKSLVVSKKAEGFLVEHGFDKTMGARPLRRTIEQYIENPLAEEILKGNMDGTTKVEVVESNGALDFQKVS